jgi:hypothetical protein
MGRCERSESAHWTGWVRALVACAAVLVMLYASRAEAALGQAPRPSSSGSDPAASGGDYSGVLPFTIVDVALVGGMFGLLFAVWVLLRLLTRAPGEA